MFPNIYSINSLCNTEIKINNTTFSLINNSNILVDPDWIWDSDHANISGLSFSNSVTYSFSIKSFIHYQPEQFFDTVIPSHHYVTLVKTI